MAESHDKPTVEVHPLHNKDLLCWAMYDWANSAYSTLLITVLIAYMQRVVFPSHEWGNTGAVVWAWGISFSMLLGAILSPVVGAIADAQAAKRRWLAIFALSGSVATILLSIVPPRTYVLVVVLFVIANLMFELSLGMYNGFLPEIVSENQMNTASAWGYALGYVGGGLALVIAMLILHYGGLIGLPTTANRLQCGLVLMGSWWALFTIPALLVLRDKPQLRETTKTLTQTIGAGGSEAVKTLRSLRRNVPLALFLLSFLFYNDGIQTIISQASTFALQELAFPEGELMAVILMIQFLAWPGSIVIARFADAFGQQRTLLGCLAVWISVLIAALWVTSQLGFWMLSAVIAFVLGGTQSVSRSLMAVMTPPGSGAQYFGFFNLSGKATSFVGTLLFGAIIAITGSSRLAIFGLLPLFAIGALLMWKVNVAPKAATAGSNV